MHLLNKQTLFLGFTALLLLGCKGLPPAYQGTFQDRAKGIKITLSTDDAVIVFKGGRKIEEQGRELKFDDLVMGKAGLFARKVEGGEVNVTDLYYINPTRASRKTENGLVWFDAEILFSQLDLGKTEQVRKIQAVHCKNGQVILDLEAKTFEMGCPAGPTNYNLVRVRERDAFNPFD